MFNSILRALMQTFLLNCVMMWTSFMNTDVSLTEGVVDFCLAILTLAFFITFTFMTLIFLRKRKDEVKESSFKIKYDSLY